MSGHRKQRMVAGLPALAKARLEQHQAARAEEAKAEIEEWRKRGDLLLFANGTRIEIRRTRSKPIEQQPPADDKP